MRIGKLWALWWQDIDMEEGLAADYKLHIKSSKKYSIILYFFLVLLYNISKEWWHFYV